MSDLSITAANVLPGADAQVEHSYFGASVTAGQVVYNDTADNEKKLADANSATAIVRKVHGIALNGGSDGQPAAVQRGGTITIGATVVVGKVYVLSATPGGIAPIDDLATGHYVTVIGVGISSTQIKLGFLESGVAVP